VVLSAAVLGLALWLCDRVDAAVILLATGHPGNASDVNEMP
jgi:hypothetical protein